MPATPAFDLQCHSSYSDGALPPAEVMAVARRDGVELVALTDHDTIEGVPEAIEVARHHGIAITPGAEISAVDGVYEDLHVCGYELDLTDSTLTDALASFRDDRQQRTEAIADRLEEMGFALDRTPLERRRREGKPIGRPHIADAVLEHPDNQDRLRAEGISDKNGFFPKYIVPGAPAFVSRTHPTVSDAIDVIHAAGGIAIWAHPFWDVDDPDEVLSAIARFHAAGLDGVEVFYPTHDEQQTRLLHDACAGRGLITTGSTDFHSLEHERFNRFRGFELHGLEPNLGPIAAQLTR